MGTCLISSSKQNYSLLFQRIWHFGELRSRPRRIAMSTSSHLGSHTLPVIRIFRVRRQYSCDGEDIIKKEPGHRRGEVDGSQRGRVGFMSVATPRLTKGRDGRAADGWQTAWHVWKTSREAPAGGDGDINENRDACSSPTLFFCCFFFSHPRINFSRKPQSRNVHRMNIKNTHPFIKLQLICDTELQQRMN